LSNCIAPAMTRSYWSMSDIAARLGVTSAAVAQANLPEPDVTIGTVRGWAPETIEAWPCECHDHHS